MFSVLVCVGEVNHVKKHVVVVVLVVVVRLHTPLAVRCGALAHNSMSPPVAATRPP